jgi:CHAT domain-containing protein
MTVSDLGLAYSERIKGSRSKNIETAIKLYKFALEIRTKRDLPMDWAMTISNLGLIYSERIEGCRAKNIEFAIGYHYQVLEIYTKEDFPIDWARTQNNLAAAYEERENGSRVDNVKKSINCYEGALQIRTKEKFPVDWAGTHNNLAILYTKLGKDELAIEHYLNSVEIFQTQNTPLSALESYRGLGNVYLKQNQWGLAVHAYEGAMQAAETSRSWSVNDGERQRILMKALSIYENAIQCAVRLGDYQLAIEYTERIRSRQMVELMASKDLYSDAQIPPEIQGYLDEYQQLSQQAKNLQIGSDEKMATTIVQRDHDELQRINAETQAIETHRQVLYNQIRAYDPVLAGQIAIAPISHQEIQQLITSPQIAILTFFSTNDDTHIFILKQNQEPERFTCIGQGKNELQQWLIDNWLIPYTQPNNSTWRKQIPTVLAELADRLQLNQLIANHLADIEELILVPHLLLHQIPFAALPIPASTALLSDRFILRSIPSCQILQYCHQRPAIFTSTQGTVEDADGSLIGARYEGQKIAEIHQVAETDRLRGKTQATVANYRQLLRRVNRLHSSHHASSCWDNPLESALFLADGKITLGELLLGERYPELDEIFLSACETHVGQFNLTDDVATLTTGFLCIGARSVQSTLWSVSDIVTAIFDIFYHQERREGYNRAISLKRAQVRLRNLSGEEFRTNYAEDLMGFLSYQLAIVSQQIAELKAEQKPIDVDWEGNRWIQLNEQIIRLAKEEKELKVNLPNLLKDYGEADRPFASPYFWAGFISQGMA